MVERYDYANIEFVDADPEKFATKPKPEPRKPLPVAITDALRETATDGAPRAVVVPGPEKAARNLVHRMRTWVAKELDGGKSVKAKVEPNGDVQGTGEPASHTVTFVVVAKRGKKSDAGEQLELPLEESPSGDAPAEEPPAKPRRSRK